MERPKSYDILEADPDISIKGGGDVGKRIASQFHRHSTSGPPFSTKLNFILFPGLAWTHIPTKQKSLTQICLIHLFTGENV